MANSKSRKQLEDAVALIQMLEQLSASYEQDTQSDTRLRWRAVGLSLEQAKGLLIQALSGDAGMSDSRGDSSGALKTPLRDSTGLRELNTGSAMAASARELSDTPRYSAKGIAGRITKAPTGSGRIRELPNENSAGIRRSHVSGAREGSSVRDSASAPVTKVHA